MKQKNKIAIAMSGGVDSSVAAKILKDEGHDLVGLFLKLWSDPTSPKGLRGASSSCHKENRCCDYEALEDARMVTAKLKIPFYVIDAKKEFKKEVVDYFLREYQNLRTPNPCIVCNETIKFDLLLKKALSIGCEKLATGHYARLASENPKSEILNPKQTKSNSNDQNSNVLNLENSNLDIVSNLDISASNFSLLKGADETKDQSYMLYRLSQDQLSKSLFPLGEMKKKAVRNLAIKWDLPVKEKPESQEICFFADKDYRAFLRRYLDQKYFSPGDIVDGQGNVIGKHDGLLNYTIGQRKLVNQELGIMNHGKDKMPLYVVGFDKEKNQLIVGNDEDIYKKEMIVSDLNWISGQKNLRTEGLKNLKVRIRYRHPEMECKIKKTGNKLHVVFDKSQRAVTPGQSAVFYLPRADAAGEDEVLGGGIIDS